MAGHPTYHVKVIKLKWEIIWTGGLLHLSGLPHLPGVPHLHVNRPLVFTITTIYYYGVLLSSGVLYQEPITRSVQSKAIRGKGLSKNKPTCENTVA